MGFMFICGFISFMVRGKGSKRILIHRSHYLALSLSHIPPLRPVSPAPPLPYPRQAIKILSATLLKNYGISPLRNPFELPCEGSLSLTLIKHEHIALFSLSLSLFLPLCLTMPSPSLLVRVSLIFVLVALPHPPLGSSSGVSTLLSVPYSPL